MLSGSGGREILKEEGDNCLAPSSIDAVCADDEVCLGVTDTQSSAATEG